MYLWKRGFEGRVGQKGPGARDGGGRGSKRGRQTEEEELENEQEAEMSGDPGTGRSGQAIIVR